MSAGWQVALYAVAVVCCLIAAWGEAEQRHRVALGWLGVACVTFVLLAGAVEAL